MKLLRLILVFIIIQSAAAQESGDSSLQLESTKQVYLAAIKDARAEVIAVLDKKILAAQRTGVLETVNLLTTEKKEFTKNGTTPSSVNMRTFHRKTSIALRTLKREFEATIKKTVQQGRLAEAKRLKDELKTFEDSPLNRSNWGIAEYKLKSGAGEWQPFANNVRAFPNKTYVWSDISPAWPVKQFAPVAAGSKTPIEIDVTSPGWVFIAAYEGDTSQVEKFLKPNAWQLTPYVFSYNSRGKQLMHIYRKQLVVGKYDIPRLNYAIPVLLKP